MIVIDQLGLRQDPFGPASSATGFGVAAPLRIARDRLLAAVRRGDPLTVLAGRPGMGKTLLLGMIEQACRSDGIEVRAVARGDMAHTALGSGAQLLLIDEADTINAATLKALAPGTAEAAAPTMVFAAAQPALHRISSDVRTTIIDLRPLEPNEAREFLLTRAVQAGRPDLFTSEALDIIVEAGRGSPRLLRVLAGAAMFQAMSDGVPRITAEHASLAAAMQGSLFGRPAAGPSLPVPANDLGPRVDTEDRPRALVPPLVRPLSRGNVGALAIAASVALTALVMPVFFLPEPTSTPSTGIPSANAASAGSGSVQAVASAFTVAPANAPAPIVPLKTSVRTDLALRAASTTAPPLIAAPIPRIAIAAIESGAPSIPPILASFVVDAVPVTHAVRPDVEMSGRRSLLIDLLAATRLRSAVVVSASSDSGQESATGDRSGAMAQPAAALLAATLPAFDEPPPIMLTRSSNEGRGATEPIEIVRPTSESASEAKQAADSSRAAKASADEASGARHVAEPANTAKLAAVVAKQGADETRATKLAAQQARESAREAEAAKEAADQARAAKAAAEQAKAAKESSEQAKAAKDAADQAKAAKDAADQAKAAKEAAEQAKAAKDTADQAKAAKDAADQAKAAKDAADQAKAAKDAADQAKAAKDAADQAKAAKDAADQAKAAKDAADQAKAAKDAADQAKAAKDAASQAKAAKEAADAAKEAAKAAKEAAKAARDAAKAGKGN